MKFLFCSLPNKICSSLNASVKFQQVSIVEEDLALQERHLAFVDVSLFCIWFEVINLLCTFDWGDESRWLWFGWAVTEYIPVTLYGEQKFASGIQQQSDSLFLSSSTMLLWLWHLNSVETLCPVSCKKCLHCIPSDQMAIFFFFFFFWHCVSKYATSINCEALTPQRIHLTLNDNRRSLQCRWGTSRTFCRKLCCLLFSETQAEEKYVPVLPRKILVKNLHIFMAWPKPILPETSSRP